MNRLFIIGCSDLSKDILSNLESNEWAITRVNKESSKISISELSEVVFVDDCYGKDNFLGYKVANDIKKEYILKYNDFFFIAFSSIKSQMKRETARLNYKSLGLEEVNIISSKAVVSKSAKLSAGCLISQGVYIGPNSLIDSGVIILFNSIISRDCALGKDVFISANVTVTANKSISKNCYIGAGVLIDAYIGANSVIGSGSKIKRNLNNHTLVDGSTNQTTRELEFKDVRKLIQARNSL